MRFQSVFGLVAILVISAIVSPIRDGHIVFLDAENLLNIVRFASENGIIAVGMTLVILTGGIDLSVGALLALCAVGTAACLMRYGLNTAETILLMLGLGACAGLRQRPGDDETANPVVYHHAGNAVRRARHRLALVGRLCHSTGLRDAKGDAPPLFKSLFAGQIGIGGWHMA